MPQTYPGTAGDNDHDVLQSQNISDTFHHKISKIGRVQSHMVPSTKGRDTVDVSMIRKFEPIYNTNLFLSVSRYVACSMPFYQLYLLREDLVCILRSHTKEPSIPLLALLILHLRYNTPFALAYLTTRMMHLVVSTIAYIVEKVNDGCIPMSFIFSRQLCYVRVQKIHIRYIKCKSKKDFVDHVQAIMQLPLQNKSS